MTTPTTQSINDLIIASLEASLNQSIPLLPKAFNRIVAKVFAGVFITLYHFIGFWGLQQFVSKATLDETTVNGQIIRPLVEWGRLVGVGDPTAATQAELLIDITVDNQVGSLLSGTQFVGATNGVTYLLIGSVLLNAASVQGTVRAAQDQSGGNGFGVIGNLQVGEVVSFAEPLANVASDAIVNSQLVTAAEAEATEVYRQRVFDRFRTQPQGGAYADYRQWGEEVEGIINIYPFTGDPGQVDVYAEATTASSGDADGIPTAAQLQAVADSIELDENGLATRRPAGAFVNVLPITRTGFDVTVSGLSVSDPAQVQSDIEQAVTEFFLAARNFIIGLDFPPRTDIITRSSIIGLVEDIVTASGGTFTTVIFFLTSTTINLESFVLSEGEKAKLATPINFVP